jgi:hypothetical protein
MTGRDWTRVCHWISCATAVLAVHVLSGPSMATAAESAWVITGQAAASPSAPGTAQPATGWTAAEIAAAKAECSTLLKGLKLDFNYAAPIRKGACGLPQPIELRAFGGKAAVAVQPPAVLNCAMAAKLIRWFQSSVQPLARSLLQSDIASISNAAAYDCRNRYGDPDQKLSEHAKANALDIGAFTLSNGVTVPIAGYWGPVLRDQVAAARSAKRQIGADVPTGSAPPQMSAATAARRHLGSEAVRQALLGEAARLGVVVARPRTPAEHFIHDVHASACKTFGTVLGPEANDAHREHFHLDLAPRSGSAFCE